MATNGAQNIATAATGKVLQGQGVGTTPAFSTATYPAASVGTGKILYDNGTNFVTSTPTFPASASSAAGIIIVSDGTNWIASTPTFPNASATTRKIIVSDGTNWTASTETWATPGSSGNFLKSDGTNWTSAAAPTGNLLIATKTLISTAIKALHATPVEVIATPGSGKGIIIVGMSAKFNYGGSNVFVAGASQKITLYYNNNTTAATVTTNPQIPNSMIVASANQFSYAINTATSLGVATGVLDNVNVAAWNATATEISGNAANDNTIDIQVAYYIVTY